jgi:hypothetical protein
MINGMISRNLEINNISLSFLNGYDSYTHRIPNTWTMLCSIPNKQGWDKTLNSTILFCDTSGLTRILINEIYFSSHLPKVGDLKIHKITIYFRNFGDKKYDHRVEIEGEGYHSILEYKVTPFNISFDASKTTIEISHELLKYNLFEELNDYNF